MKFEIEGEIVAVFDTKQISDKFSKREFVVAVDDGRYPQTILFESSGRVIEDLDDVRAKDKVRVHFNVRGREWRSPAGETKYFNSLHAWKVERVGDSQAANKPAAKPAAAPATTIDEGDIPF